MYVIKGCTLEGRTYEEKLWVILSVVEATEDTFILVDDADLIVAFGTIAFPTECL